ncbi:protein phosphatase 1 regulatory subunit 14A-like isoform X1 [Centropristis striata]|uniref:protein phosphatase 1 regulatory subunit 14A-like isoform X1 n=1 Tax=Centropristis striata TaxID=184440 RepID=UPI0027E0BC13|nr:protein phosphatase 1 regulatory subunit 14A-like isoform X1 [Centropristis striata]
MAAHRAGRRVKQLSAPRSPRGPGGGRRQARVTVQYNRSELQRRLDLERWVDSGLDRLYRDREDQMPEEVNIDELLDLKTNEERTQRLQCVTCPSLSLQVLFQSCDSSPEVFICELLLKLDGLQRQEDLHPVPRNS